MRSKWNTSILDGFVDGFHFALAAWNGGTSRSAPESTSTVQLASGPGRPDDDDGSPPLAFHASKPSRLRAQMPSTRSTGRRPQNSVRAFLNANDNAECDPIAIESDEEAPPSYSDTTYSSTKLHNSSRRRPISQPSESRHESSLIRRISSRQPDATVIEDPMKTPRFNTNSLRPVNTLDGTRPTSKSDFTLKKTHPSSTSRSFAASKALTLHDDARANNHSNPNKRAKLSHPQRSGTSSALAIALDDGQEIGESSDELRLSSPSAEHPKTQSSQTNLRQTRRGRANHVGVSRIQSVSPANEDAFTKGSAMQRKEEKDRILSSSPPNVKQVSPTTSPYFPISNLPSTTEREVKKKELHRNPGDESPDALHNDPCPPRKPYDKRATRELIEPLITGKMNNTTISQPGRGRPRKTIPEPESFDLEEILCPGILNSRLDYVIQVFPESRQFAINTKARLLSKEPVIRPFEMTRVSQLHHGPHQFVNIHLRVNDRAEKTPSTLHLKFPNGESAVKFQALLQKSMASMNFRKRDEVWMGKAFTLVKEKQPTDPLRCEEPIATAENSNQRPPPVPEVNSSARPRLVDQLDLPSKANPTEPTLISDRERAGGAKPDITKGEPRARNAENRSHSPPGRTKEIKEAPRRLTRSQEDHSLSTDPLPRFSATRRLRLSETGALGRPWARDLVYPKPGKRSATVPFEDLSRLDEDEFLNDNLITFFMQYLETFMETTRPELHKRTYFFNTYFFERLTKNVKGRGINFDAVSRWTKAIDIFSREFIIVPVNENLHWYLVIICNLQHLRPDPENETQDMGAGGSDPEIVTQVTAPPSRGVPHVSSDVVNDPENHPEPPTEETQQSMADLSINDAEPSVTGQSRPKSKKGTARRKPPRKSLPKYDIDKPIIITLDSLGASRSVTCSLLRQYIIAEGKDKRDLDIESSDIRGMTAKGIPTQSNFSDCGLYLCMYLEQFVADPSNFVARILQREEDAQSWPTRIHSEDLRSRLRELILEVHRRQENEPSGQELPDVGSIMIPKGHPRSNVADAAPTKQDIEAARKRFESKYGRKDQRHTNGVAHLSQDQDLGGRDRPVLPPNGEASPPTDSKVDVRADAIEADRHRPSSPISHTRAAAREIEVPGHKTPGELAAWLREQNEAVSRGRKRIRHSGTHETKRSDSASTDFLTSVQSYAKHNSDVPSTAPAGMQHDNSIKQAPLAEVQISSNGHILADGDAVQSKPGLSKKRKKEQRHSLSEDELFGTPSVEIPGTQSSPDDQNKARDHQQWEHSGIQTSQWLGKHNATPLESSGQLQHPKQRRHFRSMGGTKGKQVIRGEDSDEGEMLV